MTEQATNALVFDPATASAALTRLSIEAKTGLPWSAVAGSPNADLQERLLKWHYTYGGAVNELPDLKVAGSPDADVLNKFLTDNGFKPMFREISKGGVGACAIVDMLLEWAVKANVTTFEARDERTGWMEYKAFELPIHGTDIYSVPGTDEQLVTVGTTDGSVAWFLITDRPSYGLDLVDTAVSAMANRRLADTTWISSVILPFVDIDVEVPLNWMLNVSSGDHYIDQAFQLFRLRMNDRGARVKVGTGFATSRSIERKPKPLVLNRPFTGWFTRHGSNVPIAPFYSDHSTWKDGGDLADM